MLSDKSKRQTSNGRRADGSVKLVNTKSAASSSKKKNKVAGRTSNKKRTVSNDSNVKKVQKTKKSHIAVAVIFWTVILLAAFLCLAYKMTVTPPEITPVPVISPSPPATSPKVDGTSEDNPDNSTELEDDNPGIMRKKDFYTFLVIGKDKVGLNTDVLMVGSYDAKNVQANVVNIPRDTVVNVSRKIKKINAAYAYGGIDNLKEEISTLVGFKPDFYILVELDGFVTMIDAIGGVEFNVPIDMDYDDPSQGLSIHYKKGLQKLDGQSALEVIRFRHNNDGSGYPREDLDRIQTTQKLLTTVAKEMVNLKTLLKINELVDIATENLDTDLKTGEMLWLAKEALKIDIETGLHFYTYSEKTCMYKGLSYVYADKGEALDLINATVNPYTTDITDLDLIQP